MRHRHETNTWQLAGIEKNVLEKFLELSEIFGGSLKLQQVISKFQFQALAILLKSRRCGNWQVTY